jgi:hypothetical protein
MLGVASITGREAGFSSLGDGWADTKTPHGQPMLTVLGGLVSNRKKLSDFRIVISMVVSSNQRRTNAFNFQFGQPFARDCTFLLGKRSIEEA